jgi:hypothetical protein
MDLKLGFTECRVYDNTIIKSSSQAKFGCLIQVHTLNMTEDDKDRCFEYAKMLSIFMRKK